MSNYNRHLWRLGNRQNVVNALARNPVKRLEPTQADALAKAKALALRVLADRLDHGEPVPVGEELFSVA